MKSNLNKDEREISQMFNSIAPTYDRLNAILSLGIDSYWRRVLIKGLPLERESKVLDIACGTGKVTMALMERGVEAVGIDIAEKMIELAAEKSEKRFNKLIEKGKKGITLPTYIEGSADSLPFEDESFDQVTIAFGIRNFEKLESSLQEIWRVLKRGGTLSIVEFATPTNRVWNSIFSLYFYKILPLIGRLLTGHPSAYNYLPNSVDSFPQYGAFIEILEKEKFVKRELKKLTGGVALYYSAKKPDAN